MLSTRRAAVINSISGGDECRYRFDRSACEFVAANCTLQLKRQPLFKSRVHREVRTRMHQKSPAEPLNYCSRLSCYVKLREGDATASLRRCAKDGARDNNSRYVHVTYIHTLTHIPTVCVSVCVPCAVRTVFASKLCTFRYGAMINNNAPRSMYIRYVQ